MSVHLIPTKTELFPGREVRGGEGSVHTEGHRHGIETGLVGEGSVSQCGGFAVGWRPEHSTAGPTNACGITSVGNGSLWKYLWG